MIGEGLNLGGAGLGCLLDELAGVVDEDLDARGGQSHLDRAWLGFSARYGLVERWVPSTFGRVDWVWR
jgi:hypothetical protein